MDRELILSFINRAYSTACSHGFHDVERSDIHWMMLVLSEIGEMVEADRKSRHANVGKFNELVRPSSFNVEFVSYVKDTLEDELADVCIRLFDFCGTRGLVPFMADGRLIDMDAKFGECFGDYTLCEQSYALCNLVTDVTATKLVESQERALGSVLSFIVAFARHHGIDLVWHIEQKMRYNESRSKKHGKEY